MIRRIGGTLMTLALVTTTTAAPGFTQSGDETPKSAADGLDDLGNAVFEALKEGSFDRFGPHVVSAEDFDELFDYAVQDGQMTPDQKDQMAAQFPEMAAAAVASLRQDFARIHEKASWKEVSWAEVEPAGFGILVRDPETGDERTVDAATLDAENAFLAEITLRFTAGGEEHEIDLDACARTSRGWVILERMNWFDG